MVRRLVASVIALFAAAIFVAVSPSAAYADATRDKQWYLDSLRINKAHTLSQGAGVTIGLIDGGVDATHSDLKGNIKAGADFGDSKDSGLHDSDGHGTGMASILVAHGHGKGHAQGVMGIAPKAKLISYGIDCDIHCTGRTGSDGVADGIKWLTDKGVDIISISLGATPSPDAVKYATDKGVAVVASAGNDVSDFGPGIGPQKTTGTDWPASAPGAIPVTGTSKNGVFWKHSLTLKEAASQPQLGISAPAEDMIHAKKDGGYATDSGTSGSAPIVAGTLALIKSAYPKLNYTTWLARMIETVDDKGSKGFDNKYGWGIVNPYHALTEDIDYKDQYSHIKSKASDRLPLDKQGKGSSSDSSKSDKSSADTVLGGHGGIPTSLIVIVISILVVGAIVVVAMALRSRMRATSAKDAAPMAPGSRTRGPND